MDSRMMEGSSASADNFPTHSHVITYTREQMMAIRNTESAVQRPDYLSNDFNDEKGRFVPDKWFDHSFAPEPAKGSYAGRKKNLARMEDELGLSPQRRQFAGGCVPGSASKNQGTKWRNGKQMNSDAQKNDNMGGRWRNKNDNENRNERQRKVDDSVPEWAEADVTVNDVMELKGFDGVDPLTSRINQKGHPYSENDLLEDLKRAAPTAVKEEPTSGSRFIHLFKNKTEAQKSPTFTGSKDNSVFGNLGDLFSQPQSNMPSMPFSGMMASDFERLHVNEKHPMNELPKNPMEKFDFFKGDALLSDKTKSMNPANLWTEEAILSELFGRKPLEKKNSSPPLGPAANTQQSWLFKNTMNADRFSPPVNPVNRLSPASNLAELLTRPVDVPSAVSSRPSDLPSPMASRVPMNMDTNGSRNDGMPLLPSPTGRNGAPPGFNMPPFPNPPMPPPGMFVPGPNGMPMFNPYAAFAMGFSPGMMGPPPSSMTGSAQRMPNVQPPPGMMNTSPGNLPTSVLLRRRLNGAMASPDAERMQQRSSMPQSNVRNYSPNQLNENARQQISPLPDDPSEMQNGMRNPAYPNPPNDIPLPPGMPPNFHPPLEFFYNLMAFMPRGPGQMPPMGMPDGRGFPFPMPGMPMLPGMPMPGTMPPNFPPMPGPMFPPSTSMASPTLPERSSPVQVNQPSVSPTITNVEKETNDGIPDSIKRSLPTSAKMMTVEDLERRILSKN
uniref:Uncharacterized protein n=1 Tax=Panagrolaimus sp. JU765 TaxID=591449 RepID=A0AC34RMF8_9BILA